MGGEGRVSPGRVAAYRGRTRIVRRRAMTGQVAGLAARLPAVDDPAVDSIRVAGGVAIDGSTGRRVASGQRALSGRLGQ